MAEFVECQLPGGAALIVAAPDDADAVQRASSLRKVSEIATETFESAMGRLGRAAEVVRSKVSEMAESPDEVTVEFAVKIASEVGVVVANTSAEANLRVTVRWNPSSG